MTWQSLGIIPYGHVFSQTAASAGDPHTHIIDEVDDVDGGLYTCIAGNVLGQATASAYLEVNQGRRSSLSSWPCVLLAAAVGSLTRWRSRASCET